MAVVYTRVAVVVISVLLLSWGSFANFSPAYASTSIEDLQELRDDLNIEINNNLGTPLADKLEDARNKFQDVIDELNKIPPDIIAAIGNISAIQQEIQVAIDDEGFSPIIGNILIVALDALKNNLSNSTPPTTPPTTSPTTPLVPKVVVCHFPPGNVGKPNKIIISENATESHLAHGDLLGKCPGHDEDDKLRKKLEKEKNRKEIKLKKIQNEVENEIKKLKKLSKDLPDNKEFKDALKQKKEEIKELLKDLKENHAYDLELKKELKKELKIIKHKIFKVEKHEKNTKHKVDTKISSLSKSSDPETDAK